MEGEPPFDGKCLKAMEASCRFSRFEIAQKIVPHLWFDDMAEDAVRTYTTTIPTSALEEITRYGKACQDVHGQPEGRVMSVEFPLAATRWSASTVAPHFRPTPAVSFFLTFAQAENVDRIWEGLGEDGVTLHSAKMLACYQAALRALRACSISTCRGRTPRR